MQLREEGLSREIGLTNFDAQHLIMVIKNRIEIASNQVCFALLDPRAARELSQVAQDRDVAILAFGPWQVDSYQIDGPASQSRIIFQTGAG